MPNMAEMNLLGLAAHYYCSGLAYIVRAARNTVPSLEYHLALS